MEPPTKNEITRAMLKYGGGFVRALSKAVNTADALNFDRLQAAFPEIFDRYRHMAEWDRKQENTQPTNEHNGQ